jgi:hypothetical protein
VSSFVDGVPYCGKVADAASPAPLGGAKIMEREAALMTLEDFELDAVFP